MTLYKSKSKQPPWEVLVLIAQTLDPKTLATSSCVCRTWHSCFSSDRQWEPICHQEFPNVSNLKSTHPNVPYRTLYSLGFTAAKRRVHTPSKPSISLQDLIFAIDVINTESKSNKKSTLKQLWITGYELASKNSALFQFDVVLEECGDDDVAFGEGLGKIKVVWNVVLSGWRGVFCMMESEGKVGSNGEGWFSNEVVSCGGCCCCREVGSGSGLMADLRIAFCRDEVRKEMRAVRVSMGLLSSFSWRYVCMDDGLRYLQHFLSSRA